MPGYYGDFSYVRGQNIAQLQPSAPFWGELDAHFGSNSDPNPEDTFTAYGKP
jgi:hypothetical protein